MKLNKKLAVLCALLAFGTIASAKIKLVTTIFPEYDWAKQIIGNAPDVELTLLLGNGVDLHSYQPSVRDITKILQSDIFIYVGGESDEWVAQVLKNSRNKNMEVINLLECLGEKAKKEEIIEGMECETDKNEGEEEELDEHVWLSLKNAAFFCDAIADSLCEKDAANEKIYRKNLASYKEKLSVLDKKYAGTVKTSKNSTLIFGDRFPFRYLVDDYDLNYYAAFAGCSAETEASFKTIAFLSKKIDELDLNSVFQIEGGNSKIAKTVVSNSKKKNIKILTLDSLQSTTTSQIKSGATYIGLMEKNLVSLKEALN